MKTKPALAAAAAVVALAVAPSAFAQDYCVADVACVNGGGTNELTVEAALAASDATVGTTDRVLIGPGTYSAPTTAGFAATKSPVEIIGAGSGATTLTGPADTGIVVHVSKPGSRVADVGIAIPANSTNATKVGLYAESATAERLKITGNPALSTVAIGAELYSGSVLQDSVVEVPSAHYTIGVDLQAGATARRDAITGRVGVQAYGAASHLDRARINATGEGISAGASTDLEVTNSLIETTTNAWGVAADASNGDAHILVRNSTVVGDGSPDNAGIVADGMSGSASIALDSSIVSGFEKSLYGDDFGGPAAVSAQYSDFDSSKVATSGAGVVTLGPGNTDADPRFIGASDFHLQPGSPAIEVADPAGFSDAADLDGDARVVDADGDGIARRDMGAFEVPVMPPPVPPSESSNASSAAADAQPAAVADPRPIGGSADLTAPTIANLAVKPRRFAVGRIGLSVQRGGRLAFTLSERAAVRITIRKRLAHGRTRTIGRLTQTMPAGAGSIRLPRAAWRPLRPGSYSAQIVASDESGNRSRAYSVRFRVVKP